MTKLKRKYISIDDIQKEYLPIGKKRIRALVKKYLQVKMIGNRMYIERESFERLLSNPDIEHLPLN